MPNEDQPCPGLQQADKVEPDDGVVRWSDGKGGYTVIPDALPVDLRASGKAHRDAIAQERIQRKGQLPYLKEPPLRRKRP